MKFIQNINRKTRESGDNGSINNKINNGTSHGSMAEIIVELVLESSTLFKDEFGVTYGLLKEK